MSKVVVDMSMSLDGIGAGPNPNEEDRMGVGGERLHAWMPFYDPEQDPTAGVPAANEVDTRAARELMAAGAVVLGKRTFDLGSSRGVEPRSRCRASCSLTRPGMT